MERKKINNSKPLLVAIYASYSMQLQIIQKQPSCKKVCSPEEGHCKINVKSKVVAEKWL